MEIYNIENQREIRYEAFSFSGGERHIQLDSYDEKLNELIIRARLNSGDEIIDLLLLGNALRNKYGADLKIDLELPYLPYARQDRVCAPGQPFSLEVFENLLQLLKLRNLIVWDCHSQAGISLTGAKNISPVNILKKDNALINLLKDTNTILVCPDKGAVTRCANIKEEIGLDEIVLCEKHRDPATGKILQTEVLSGDLTGKCAVITDDICDGGYTFINIAEQLRKKNVKKVVLFVTHGIFSKGLSVFDGLIDEVITTNSFDQKAHPKLRVIDFEYNFESGVGE